VRLKAGESLRPAPDVAALGVETRPWVTGWKMRKYRADSAPLPGASAAAPDPDRAPAVVHFLVARVPVDEGQVLPAGGPESGLVRGLGTMMGYESVP